MVPPQDQSLPEATAKFVILTKKLLSTTDGRSCEKKMLNSYLNEINGLDYKSPIAYDSSATLLLTNQLCSNVQPSELELVKSVSKFLINLVRCGERFYGRTFVACKRWILECLKFAEDSACNDLLNALQSILRTGPFDIIDQDLRNLLGNGGVLPKFISEAAAWTETQFLATSCIEAILINKESQSAKVSPEFLVVIQNMALDIISSLSYESQNKQCYNKIIGSSLRILRSTVIDKSIPKTADTIGKIFGVVQSLMLHGVKGYPFVKPSYLRPAAMNLPEAAHSIPKSRNLRSHKYKSRRQQPKKDTTDASPNVSLQATAAANKYPSDSDTSDTEAANSVQMESKVRFEVLQLLNALVQNTSSRDIFGYWPQLVASGSPTDARVLSKCILKEPVSKVRQVALTTLTELLVGAKQFLMHAEDAERSSFVTFFGTVSAMIRELHTSLSLLLSTERNIAVLTHCLKCSAALAQGTPYSRLKPGLATKLIRNCRLQIFHKDPTVRVAALLVFEALATSDPITPEILNIFLKQSKSDTDTERPQLNLKPPSNDTAEIEFEPPGVEDDEEQLDYCQNDKLQEISSLLYACLKNVSNEVVSIPVRLGSVKLIGALAFNCGTVVFPHLKIVATALVAAAIKSESPVALHAGRVIETIAGCLVVNSTSDETDAQIFWNIVFDPIAKLAQSPQTTLREVACDCLGNIGSKMLSLLSRERSIMVITTLFGAARDEESAVRAAALRALGMLVELPSLDEDVGFLMDLVDVVCLGLADQNPGVRVKAAWTLANLCDCLVRQDGRGNEEAEPIPLEDVLPRLHQASVKGAKDHVKVKCNAVRAIGSTLYLCRNKQLIQDTTPGLEALLNCAVTGNDMKVRWNACRALGFVLSHNPDRILPSTWRDQIFPALCGLVCVSPNFKVRTNAAWALSVCQSYGKNILPLWRSIITAFENSQHVPSYVEYSHRDALVQQLCLTLSHLAVHTLSTELPALWEVIRDHIEDIALHMKQFQERVLPEKAGDITRAKDQMTKYSQSATTAQARQIAHTLVKLFERSNCYDNLDINSAMAFP